MVDKEKAKIRKQRHYQKVYDNTEMIECKCGCGELIKSKDKYGRDKQYVSGHNGRKYDDPTQYKREWNYRNRQQRQEYRDEYIKKRKENLITTKGGRCVKCGIEFDGTNSAIFDFHHINPEEKEFPLNKGTLNKLSMARILNELAKCDLVCSNCHRLIHFKNEQTP